jgi:hypothetical protein
MARDLLAKNIALRNPSLSVEELNVAVQKTIDRILFLRICEDRGIEPYGCLQNLLEQPDIYLRLLGLFQRPIPAITPAFSISIKKRDGTSYPTRSRRVSRDR